MSGLQWGPFFTGLFVTAVLATLAIWAAVAARGGWSVLFYLLALAILVFGIGGAIAALRS